MRASVMRRRRLARVVFRTRALLHAIERALATVENLFGWERT